MTSLQTRLSVLIGVIALGAVVVLFGLLGRAPAIGPIVDARPVSWTDLLPEDEARFFAAIEEGTGPTSEEDWIMQEASRAPIGLMDGAPDGGGIDGMAGGGLAWDAPPQMTPAALPRDDLDGERIALSGYMTPLDFEAMETQAFLLVPYVGACIHVPAPPANQIVFVESATPVPVVDMWQPLTAIGTLQVQRLDTGIAESAYVMDLERLVALDTTGGPDEDYTSGEMQ